MIDDLRGQLPYHSDFGTYDVRPIAGVTGCTIHHSGSPAMTTVQAIAIYQTSFAAAGQTGTGLPFPGIAYHFVVTGDGTPHLCWNLDTAVWHSALSWQGTPQNQSSVGICFTGYAAPTTEQINGVAVAVVWCERRLGREIDSARIIGHRDPDPAYTECPGSAWPNWKPTLLEAIRIARQDAPPAFKVSQPMLDYLAAHPEWGVAAHDEEPTSFGAVVLVTAPGKVPPGGVLVWRRYLKRVAPSVW